MTRISIIFGTRPEAIKLAPVITALRSDSRFDCRVCSTGQHREMLDSALEAFSIKPDCDLKLMEPGQTLGELTGRAMTALDACFAREKPDLVLVQGDTTTTFCATLAAFYHHIPVGHVEAGLRTGNIKAPWPEEANRLMISRLATLHFAPTEKNRQNLIREGVTAEQIFVTGNTGIDALLLACKKIDSAPPAAASDSKLVLITGHRRENSGSGFENICAAITRLAEAFPHVQFVYPMHLNPGVRATVQGKLGGTQKNVQLCDPLPYPQFVTLMKRSTVILTDSGGIQEEAPSVGKPVLVMRETTERTEALEAGTVKLVGTDTEAIFRECSTLLTDPVAYEKMATARNPYGDGNAAARIVEACALWMSQRTPSSSPSTTKRR